MVRALILQSWLTAQIEYVHTHGGEAVLGILGLHQARVDAPLPHHGVLTHRLHAGADADGVVPRLDGSGHVSHCLQPRGALPAVRSGNDIREQPRGERGGGGVIFNILKLRLNEIVI